MEQQHQRLSKFSNVIEKEQQIVEAYYTIKQELRLGQKWNQMIPPMMANIVLTKYLIKSLTPTTDNKCSSNSFLSIYLVRWHGASQHIVHAVHHEMNILFICLNTLQWQKTSILISFLTQLQMRLQLFPCFAASQSLRPNATRMVGPPPSSPSLPLGIH